MTRTQIQLPDELLAKAKRFCKAREMSFADLARRGIESILAQHPAPEEVQGPWTLPLIRGGVWRKVSDAQLKELAQKTSFEEELEEKAKRRARH